MLAHAMEEQDWWVEEFRTLRAEAMERFRLAQNILSFAMVLIAGAGALLVSDFFTKLESTAQVIALAAISTVFSCLTATYFRHERYVTRSAKYIATVLYPKVNTKHGEQTLFWERWLRLPQWPRWFHTPIKGAIWFYAKMELAIWSAPLLLAASGFLAYAFISAIGAHESVDSRMIIAMHTSLGVASMALLLACVAGLECQMYRRWRFKPEPKKNPASSPFS